MDTSYLFTAALPGAPLCAQAWYRIVGV